MNNKFLEWISTILGVLGFSSAVTFWLTKRKYNADTDLSKAQARKINTEERGIIMDELKELRQELQEVMSKNLQLERDLLNEKNKCNTLLRRITVLETYPFKK